MAGHLCPAGHKFVVDADTRHAVAAQGGLSLSERCPGCDKVYTFDFPTAELAEVREMSEGVRKRGELRLRKGKVNAGST